MQKSVNNEKWKEGPETGEIAIGEREMRESENGKKKWCLRFMKEDIRKRRTTINENVKTCATINVWHFGYPSASGKKERIGKTWNWKHIIL